MNQKLLTLPLRIGLDVTRTAIGLSFRISTQVAGTVIDVLRPSHPSQSHRPADQAHPTEPRRPGGGPGPDAPEGRAREVPLRRTPAAPEHRDPRSNGQPEAPPVARTAPPPPTPVTPPQQQPDTPLTPTQDAARTLQEEDEVVAEFAEPGAEEGAGAQLDVQEPWEGYRTMNANAVVSRINRADAAELALVELFEQTHKKRQTVLAAAEKRLRTLSPPDAV